MLTLTREYQLKDERYYKITLQKDLLGDWLVCRNWGGLKTRIHGEKKQGFSCLGKALIFTKKVNKTREQRGYEISRILKHEI